MAFFIAAACGREPGLGKQKGPILSIAAGAFGWRALARRADRQVPIRRGLIPKGAIATPGLRRRQGHGVVLSRQSRRNPCGNANRCYQEAYERGKVSPKAGGARVTS